MASYEQRLTEQLATFSALAGGGLPAAEEPVRPEPPFAPFTGYRLRSAPGVRDEGRRRGGVGGFFERIRPPEPESEPDLEEALDFRPHPPGEIRVVRVHPEEHSALLARESAMRLLGSAAALDGVLSFELLGLPDEVRVQWAAAKAEAEFLRGVARAHLGKARVSLESDALGETWQGLDAHVMEFRLESVVHFPLAAGGADPMPALAAALGGLREGERALVQVLFEPARHPWAESLLRCVRHRDGTPVFEDSSGLLQAAVRKTSSPMFAAVVRAAAAAEGKDRAAAILGRIAGCIGSVGGTNRLVRHTGGTPASWQDFLARRSRRFGMLLNAEELATFTSPP